MLRTVVAGVALFAAAASWAGVEIKETEFSDLITLLGEPEKRGTFFGGYPEAETRLVSIISKKTGKAEYFFTFDNLYSASSWRFWNSAATDKAEDLKVVPITRKVISCRGGCSYNEHIMVILSRPMLEQVQDDTPLRIQISGRDASPVVFRVDRPAAREILDATAPIEARLRK